MNIVLNMDRTGLSVQDASTIIIPILMENVNLTSLDVFTVMEFVFLANLHFRTTLPTIFVKFLTVFKLISQVASTVNILSNWTKTKNVSWTIAWDGIVKVVFNANLFTILKTENVLKIAQIVWCTVLQEIASFVLMVLLSEPMDNVWKEAELA